MTMARKLAMARKLITALMMITLVTAWPASGVFAQAAPVVSQADQAQKADKNDNSKKNSNDNSSSKSKQAPQPSTYSQQAGGVLIGAFDRAMGEIDAAPEDMSPTDVKNATFRRRLLELRLLIDTNSFIYNHDQLKAYRDVVDAAYQAIGDYQDISVIQKIVPSVQIAPAVINARHNQMNESMYPLRDGGWRNEVRGFFSDPRPSVRSSPGSPRLWDDA